MSRVKIPAGLRGSITQRGKNSFRVRLSLGRNAEGKYEEKAETIRGTAQDALDLLIRWNVQYLDNAISVTNYQTVQQAYDEWIEHIRTYRAPNTHRFYTERFTVDILPLIGHKRLKDLTLLELQEVLKAAPKNDRHNKRALRAFLNWCTNMGKCPRFDFSKLETKSRPKPKTEQDVWNFEQVRKVYEVLTYDNLYDIFIVIGIECGLRPGEILALTWDKIQQDHIVIDTAVKKRQPGAAVLGPTKTEQIRAVPTTPYLMDKLTIHRVNQAIRIANTRNYNTEANLVVADAMGNVPNLGYIRKYMRDVAQRAGVHYIPPKNLRSTYISLLSAIGVPMPVIQESVGHASPNTTSQHYIRVFNQNLRQAASLLYQHLHNESR